MDALAPIVISVGCPCGIGPEVALRALATTSYPVRLVGDPQQLFELALALGLPLDPGRIISAGDTLAPEDRRPGEPSARAGQAQLAYLDRALALVTSGQARALVTGPINKEAVATSGAPGAQGFRGHTEYLQARLRAPEVVMAFWHERLVTALVTTHLPLAKVPEAITPARVASSIFWLAHFLHRLRPQTTPRLAVASLNPHAGEHGLLGGEEKTSIAPGIRLAEARLAQAQLPTSLTGPLGAESAMRLAYHGELDGVVAMYHDQATIPMKLVGFGEAVNISLGLPIVRTSVDHGTAYDRAGRGTASAEGMIQALRLAHQLTSER